jgi:hypothetical protein
MGTEGEEDAIRREKIQTWGGAKAVGLEIDGGGGEGAVGRRREGDLTC